MNPKPSIQPAGRNLHTPTAQGQHLRLHQPHDSASDGSDNLRLSTDRHELAYVVGKISCRLRQHVASATMHSGMLARRLSADPRNMAILNEVLDSVKALESLVDGLSDYAADSPPHLETVSLKPLVDEVIETMKDRLKRQNVTVEISVPSAISVDVDRRMLGAAFRNLTVSALSSMPRGGQLVVTAVASPSGIEIEVADSGPGLSATEISKAFVPLRSSQAGTSGLELAIAEHVVTAHGGQATARNCPEGGIALTLHLPWRRAKEAVA